MAYRTILARHNRSISIYTVGLVFYYASDECKIAISLFLCVTFYLFYKRTIFILVISQKALVSWFWGTTPIFFTFVLGKDLYFVHTHYLISRNISQWWWTFTNTNVFREKVLKRDIVKGIVRATRLGSANLLRRTCHRSHAVEYFWHGVVLYSKSEYRRITQNIQI